MESKHLLVVDDDEDFVEVMREVLESSRFDVHIASSTETACSVLRNCHIDLVLCDVAISVNAGSNLGQIAAADSRLNHVPILFMTEDIRLAEKITGPVLMKPFDFDTLVSMVHESLC